jgi:hypothetical protein
MVLEPASVALKFGFLIVLYLFLLWIARSALKDLRRPARGELPNEGHDEGTSVHSASRMPAPGAGGEDPHLQVERGAGLQAGAAYDLLEGALLGRGDAVDIRLEDPFASNRHCEIVRQGELYVIEDLGSTNGTYLNEEPLTGPQPLHVGDRIRIGDTEFSYLA